MEKSLWSRLFATGEDPGPSLPQLDFVLKMSCGLAHCSAIFLCSLGREMYTGDQHRNNLVDRPQNNDCYRL